MSNDSTPAPVWQRFTQCRRIVDEAINCYLRSGIDPGKLPFADTPLGDDDIDELLAAIETLTPARRRGEMSTKEI